MAPGVVGDSGARRQRVTVGLAGDADQTSSGLGRDVEAGELSLGAAAAPARGVGVDDAGVDAPQVVVANAEALGDAGPEVVHSHVGALGQPRRYLLSLLRLQVEGDAALAPVVGQEVGAEALGLIQQGHVAAQVAQERRLDFGDLGSHVGQGHGGLGTLLIGREVQHFDAR
jgi:hypothetical protein